MSETVIVTTKEQLGALLREMLGEAQHDRGEISPEARELERLRRKEYLTSDEVEKLFSLNANTLRRRRVEGLGPSYVKDGERVLYARQAVEQYLESRRQKTHDQP